MLKRLLYILIALSLGSLLAACPAHEAANTRSNANQWTLKETFPDTFHSSMWTALNGHFKLGNANKPDVQREIKFFKKHPTYIKELTTNARPYLYYVFTQTEQRGMPAEIALMPMIESNYQPFQVSVTGATGLWQMMPGTASGFGLKINWWYDGRRDILASTKAALDYIAYLHDYFGSWLLAMAAYDSGEGTVQAAIQRNKRLGRPTDFWHLSLPLETKTYVPKILALAAIIHDPKKYDLTLQPLPNQPYFTAVDVKGQLDLNRVAKLANTDAKTVRELNPGFRRWSTMPKTTYALLLPKEKSQLFQANLNATKGVKVNWQHHDVKAGESLSELALNYHTTVAVIKKANNINNNTIRIGEKLLIPQGFINKNRVRYHPAEQRIIAEDHIPGPKRLTHTVQSGETLWSIAARFHTTPEKIRYWNKLSYNAALSPGRKLTIWQPRAVARARYYTYKVRPGDSLYRLAHRFDVTTHQIAQANGMMSNMIRIGEKIKIPKARPTT